MFEETLCLVTGGAGAIGSHLVEALIERGAEVDVLDDLSTGRADNLPPGDRVRLLVEDIAGPELRAKLGGRRYHYVFHLAAHFANSLSIREPRRSLAVNLLGTLHILQALERSVLRRFVFASSSCVYGHNGCADESAALRPGDLDTPYAIGKFSAEALVDFWHRQFGLPAVVLRYFNSYGPRDWPGPSRSVIPNFIAWALAGRPLQVTGSGGEIRDFTYVEDLVSATLQAAVAGEAVGRTFNIGSGTGIAVIELAERINALAGNTAGIVFRPRRTWDRCAVRIADIAAAKKCLGLENRVPLAEGLARTLDWYRRAAPGQAG